MKSVTPRIVVRREERRCELCDGSDLEELWSYDRITSARTAEYLFKVRNVICLGCGFVFVSPVFSSEDLESYYADSFGHVAEAAADFDSDTRAAFIRRHATRRGTIVEIGSNVETTPSWCSEAFDTVLTVEPNLSCEATYRSIEEVPSEIADMLTHYFVLEHIPAVRPFLRECVRILKPGGVMICEVPDLANYSEEPAGLELFEHTNHFCPETLAGLAAREGLGAREFSRQDCSRSFGFAAAFENGSLLPARALPPVEKSRACFHAGLDRVRQHRKMIGRIRDKILLDLQSGRRAILWAANDLMRLALEGVELPSSAVIVDINPEKKCYFPGTEVRTPDIARGAIAEAEEFFIFSDINAPRIVESIRKVRNDIPAIHVVPSL